MAQSIHSLISTLRMEGMDDVVDVLGRLPQADVDRIVRNLDHNLVISGGYAARRASEEIAEAFAFMSAVEIWNKEASA